LYFYLFFGLDNNRNENTMTWMKSNVKMIKPKDSMCDDRKKIHKYILECTFKVYLFNA